jgi:3-dehydrosphinganine reductase
MRNNYFTAAYAAWAMLRMWLEGDKRSAPIKPRLRRIVFVNSAAAFLGMPGYAAYTGPFPRQNKAVIKVGLLC